MPNTQLYTKEAAMAKATLIIDSLALSKLRFVVAPFAPSQFTTKAELVAAEANFSGYTAGGYTLTAWTGPSNKVTGGAGLLSPLVNPTFDGADITPVTNVLSGFWVEDAGGDVRLVGTFDPTITMAAAGDTFPWIREIVEGLNVAV